jgi:hypothetical protein
LAAQSYKGMGHLSQLVLALLLSAVSSRRGFLREAAMRIFLPALCFLVLIANVEASHAASKSNECLENPLAKGCSAKPTPPKTNTQGGAPASKSGGGAGPTNKGR